MDVSLEFGLCVSGSLLLRPDRNSIWAYACMNELGGRDIERGKGCSRGQGSETTGTNREKEGHRLQKDSQRLEEEFLSGVFF